MSILALPARDQAADVDCDDLGQGLAECEMRLRDRRVGVVGRQQRLGRLAERPGCADRQQHHHDELLGVGLSQLWDDVRDDPRECSCRLGGGVLVVERGLGRDVPLQDADLSADQVTQHRTLGQGGRDQLRQLIRILCAPAFKALSALTQRGDLFPELGI